MEPDHPPRHILLATTGASPQVVTETLYAIHREGKAWPDEIRLITTAVGRRKAHKGMLEEGHLQRLCDELERPCPHFGDAQIRVVPDAEGREVEDARSLEDHEALANFIMTEVRDLSAVEGNTLHASLAGGRKTMTFYLGYAMSLFGRHDDLLSHVLVSEAFEGHPGFWFPTAAAAHRYLQDRDGNRIDASQARVTLAPIPFIRHRHHLPTLLPQLGDTVNFGALVRLINLGDQPGQIRLCIDLPGQRFLVSDAAREPALRFEFRPSLLALAFYTLIARATLAGDNDITRPEREAPCCALLKSLLDELLPLYGLAPAESTRDAWAQLIDANELAGTIKDATLSAIQGGIKPTWFDQRRNELGKLLRAQLPEPVCAHLSPALIWSEGGARLARPGSTKGGGYGIPLAPEQITLIEVALDGGQHRATLTAGKPETTP